MGKNNEPIFFGLDPSLAETGLVGIKNGELIISQLIKTKKKDDTPLEEIMRLREIVNRVHFFIEEHNPVAITIEGIAMMARNTTALAQLCGLNYMLRDTCYDRLPTYIVTPTGLKKFITGKGNCQKDLMFLEVYKRYKISFNNNNLCDAFSLAKVCEAIVTDGIKLTSFQEEVVKTIKKQI